MKKLYPCKKCGTKVIIRSKGLCPGCRQQEMIATDGVKTRYSISKQTPKNAQEKAEKKELLDPFYEYHISQIRKGARCIHCDTQLMGIRDEVAHILPKRKYKSVMNNLENAAYMCSRFANNCHSEWDSHENNAKYLAEMPGVAKVIEQFNKFKHLVLEKGKELSTLESIS